MKLTFWIFLAVLFQQSFCDSMEDSDDSEECEDDGSDMLPSGLTVIDSLAQTTVKLYFITPDNTSIPLNSTNWQGFNNSNPIKFLIHGEAGYQEEHWVHKMAEIYHANGDYNILVADWSNIIETHDFYIVSVIDAVGKVLGDFILDVTETQINRLKDFHIIGKGVGAQIAGSTGEFVTQIGHRVGRITALGLADLNILDAFDADFVDVYHVGIAYGEEQYGTVDFYLNGNDTLTCKNNTECEPIFDTDEFYIITITDQDRFRGVACNDTRAITDNACNKSHLVTPGEYVPKNITGNFLITNASAFAIKSNAILISLIISLLLWKIY